ncbi:MAG: 1-acyl-sn-glycerol-3-phosphate acyltransferase [Flavobacteriales bacterium]|nr:1-acyl-sn-glycerol-3-phosphate acyltransferase [Flavobacteriales bacterium]
MSKVWFGYWFKSWSVIYKICYAIVRTGMRTYFKRYELHNFENLPKDSGLLFAANHQNAFLDPIILAAHLKKPVYFLTRADIFKKKLANKILRKVHMLPIFRQRDGVDTAEKNKGTFSQCHDILNNKEHVLIFPEGNHNYKKHLRTPLKKGISRIALGAAEKYNFNIKLYVIPLGIDYSNHFNMNAEMLSIVGKPIDVSDYYESYQNNPTETINNLNKDIATQLKSVMIDIKDQENYQSIYNLLHRFPIQSKKKPVSEKVAFQKKVLEKIDSLKSNNIDQFNKLLINIETLFNTTKKHKLRAYLFNKIEQDKMSSKALGVSMLLILFFPLHCVGLISNYIPYKIPVWFVNSKVKDIHFHSSLKLATGVVCFAIYWALLLLLVVLLFGWKMGLYYTISLPFLAFLNWKYWLNLIKTSGRIQFKRLDKRGELKEAHESFNAINKQLGL